MSITAHLPVGTIRSLAETHPRLKGLRTRLVDDLHIEPERAGRLIVSLVTHAVEDLGDAFLGEMGKRLRRIDSIRGHIAEALDHVITEGLLPPDLDHAGLSRLFDDLQQEMEGLQSARRYAETHPLEPSISRMTGSTEPPGKVGAGFRPIGDAAAPSQGFVGGREPGMLRDAMTALQRDHPQRAGLFMSVMQEQGDRLSLAVLAETETAQIKAMENLRDALGPHFPQDRWAELTAAVDELGIARHRAGIGPGSAADAVRAQRLASLPADLRKAIGGDRTTLGPLAEQNPAFIGQLWQKWNATPKKQTFHAYVRGEMSSEVRPILAEWQAAHDLAQQHGVALLKDPAAFDPTLPNQRRVNPREGGTDLLGLREDGEIWYVDDKSHRLPPSSTTSGINLSNVSAFEGRGLIRNMIDDATEMEAGFVRMANEGHAPDPRAVEAAARIRRAAEALDRRSAGWSDADFDSQAGREAVAAILAQPDHRIRLKVTSTMGDVHGVTARLTQLGVDVLPPFAAKPTSAAKLP